jgi:hypothetical protein
MLHRSIGAMRWEDGRRGLLCCTHGDCPEHSARSVPAGKRRRVGMAFPKLPATRADACAIGRMMKGQGPDASKGRHPPGAKSPRTSPPSTSAATSVRAAGRPTSVALCRSTGPTCLSPRCYACFSRLPAAPGRPHRRAVRRALAAVGGRVREREGGAARSAIVARRASTRPRRVGSCGVHGPPLAYVQRPATSAWRA